MKARPAQQRTYLGREVVSESPVVSCIIVAPNIGSHLADAIKSILAQKYQLFELIIACTEEAMIKRVVASAGFSPDASRIKFIEMTDDEGLDLGAARNVAVNCSRGEYIAFLSPHDVWLPRKLERQVELLQKTPEAALVFGRPQMWFSWTSRPEDSCLDHFCELGVEPNSLVSPPALLTQMLQNQFQTATISDALMPRGILREIGGFEAGAPIAVADQRFLASVQLLYPVFVAGECWSKERCYRRTEDERCGPEASPTLPFLQWLTQLLRKKKVKDTALRKELNNQLQNHSIEPIEKAIRSNFPAFPLKSTHFVSEGKNSRAYRVNDRYLFKFPKCCDAEIGLLRERIVLEMLNNRSHKLPVPFCEFTGNGHRLAYLLKLCALERRGRKFRKRCRQVLLKLLTFSHVIDRGNEFFGMRDRLFLGYPQIHGDLLYPDVLSRLPAKQQIGIATDVGRFLSALHTIEISEQDRMYFPRIHHSMEHCDVIVRDMLCGMHARISGAKMRRLENFIGDTLETQQSENLLHGDFCWDHVLVRFNDMRVAGFIDFGSSCIGEPGHDFVPIFESYGTNFLSAVIDHYNCGSASSLVRRVKLLALCERVVGISRSVGSEEGPIAGAAWDQLGGHIDKYLC